jgi:GxxExxY protein
VSTGRDIFEYAHGLARINTDGSMKFEKITEKIIEVFYKVYNSLGYGFLEKAYEKAMIIEFKKAGINFKNQHPINVYYDNEIIGDYLADFVIEEKIIV